jgi:hypothetical protein
LTGAFVAQKAAEALNEMIHPVNKTLHKRKKLANGIGAQSITGKASFQSFLQVKRNVRNGIIPVPPDRRCPDKADA